MTWYWYVIVIHCTSANPRQDAGKEGIFYYWIMIKSKEQWGGIKHRPNNQSGYDVDTRSKNRSNLCNAHESVPQRIALIKMGHPQPSMPMQTNNSSVHSFLTKQHNSKTNKGNGHAFALAKVSRRPRELQVLLETRETELSRLLQKAPPRVAS